jgi:hypothetical protein
LTCRSVRRTTSSYGYFIIDPHAAGAADGSPYRA